MSDELDAGNGGMALDNSAPPPEGAVSDSEGSVKSTGTLAGGNASDKPVSAPANWPDDWRAKLAGEDKSYLKTLDRFNSPADLAKAYRDAQQRLSSGNLKSTLPDNPTQEELVAWRAENGVPESPDGYKFDVGNGFVWSDADKPVLDSFAAYALENNIPASYAQKIAAFYASTQERNMAMIQDFDDRVHQESEDALRSEWGNEFRRNLNAINNTLSAHAPDDVIADLLASRTPSGKRLGDDPAMLKVLASISRQANPSATVVPANGFTTTDDELSSLEKFMRENRQEWFKDSAKQERYRELLEAREASRSRGRAA